MFKDNAYFVIGYFLFVKVHELIQNKLASHKD